MTKNKGKEDPMENNEIAIKHICRNWTIAVFIATIISVLCMTMFGCDDPDSVVLVTPVGDVVVTDQISCNQGLDELNNLITEQKEINKDKLEKLSFICRNLNNSEANYPGCKRDYTVKSAEMTDDCQQNLLNKRAELTNFNKANETLKYQIQFICIANDADEKLFPMCERE